MACTLFPEYKNKYTVTILCGTLGARVQLTLARFLLLLNSLNQYFYSTPLEIDLSLSTPHYSVRFLSLQLLLSLMASKYLQHLWKVGTQPNYFLIKYLSLLTRIASISSMFTVNYLLGRYLVEIAACRRVNSEVRPISTESTVLITLATRGMVASAAFTA